MKEKSSVRVSTRTELSLFFRVGFLRLGGKEIRRGWRYEGTALRRGCVGEEGELRGGTVARNIDGSITSEREKNRRESVAGVVGGLME